MIIPNIWKNKSHVPVTTNQISYKIPFNRHFPMVFLWFSYSWDHPIYSVIGTTAVRLELGDLGQLAAAEASQVGFHHEGRGVTTWDPFSLSLSITMPQVQLG